MTQIFWNQSTNLILVCNLKPHFWDPFCCQRIARLKVKIMAGSWWERALKVSWQRVLDIKVPWIEFTKIYCQPKYSEYTPGEQKQDKINLSLLSLYFIKLGPFLTVFEPFTNFLISLIFGDFQRFSATFSAIRWIVIRLSRSIRRTTPKWLVSPTSKQLNSINKIRASIKVDLSNCRWVRKNPFFIFWGKTN